MVLENLSGSKSFFSPRFASGIVYRLLLYVLKVAMHVKSKRFQTARDICKFSFIYIDQQHFLSCYGQYSWRFLILFIHYSMPFYFLLYVSTVFEKDSQQLLQIILQYFNLFMLSHAMKVNTYLRTLCNKNKNTF